MATSIDWARLYEQGRCKDIGVPWTEVEAIARSKGVPAEYVRKGILDLQAYKKAEAEYRASEAKETTVPLERLKKERLVELALENNLSIDPAAITRETLVRELKVAGVPDRVPKT